MTKSFPGNSQMVDSDINNFNDVLISLHQPNPLSYLLATQLRNQCKKQTNTTCFDAYMNPERSNQTKSAMHEGLNNIQLILNTTDYTPGFGILFSSLWHLKLPCFDTKGISALEEGERGILKQCKWKGKKVPCSGIFTTFPTDVGMCCSFNMKAADKIFADSLFSTMVQQLQAEDYNTSFENGTLPDWYTNKSEPKSQRGINLGLEVILDGHSDHVEALSIDTDFGGFNGIVTDPRSFPLTKIGGFNIKAGHNNLIALSASRIEADDNLKLLQPSARKCLYPDESGSLKLFKTYSQANCLLECNLNFARKKQAVDQNHAEGCTPWYFPFVDDAFKMCDPFQTLSISKNIQNVPFRECIHCLPDCNRTVYSQKVTIQPFRQCDERNLFMTDFCTLDAENMISPQIWAKQVIENFVRTNGKVPAYLSNLKSSKRTIKDSYILHNFFDGLKKDYDAYDQDIAVLNVFFDWSAVVQYSSQPMQTWTDYFAAIGGALGLCIGLNIMTIIEIICLCLIMGGLCKKMKKDPNKVKRYEGTD